jgi:hypothetical protein
MKKIWIFTALIVPILLIGCAAAQSAEEEQVDTLTIENPYAPQEGDQAMLQDGAMVDNARWDEAAQTLIVSGSLATPCNQLRASVSQNGSQIDFTVYSVSEVDVICAQMLEPFEASFKIEGFSPESYTVTINGQVMQF